MKPEFVKSNKTESVKTFINPKNQTGLTYKLVIGSIPKKKLTTMDTYMDDYKFPGRNRIYNKIRKICTKVKASDMHNNRFMLLVARKLAKYGYGDVNVEIVLRV